MILVKSVVDAGIMPKNVSAQHTSINTRPSSRPRHATPSRLIVPPLSYPGDPDLGFSLEHHDEPIESLNNDNFVKGTMPRGAVVVGTDRIGARLSPVAGV